MNLCYTRTDDIKDLSALRAFLALRSANAIEIKDVGAGIDGTDAGICGDLYELLTTRASKVQRPIFENGGITSKTFFELFGNFEDLQTFAYFSYKDQREHHRCFDSFWLHGALLAHMKSSLRSLTVIVLSGRGAYMAVSIESKS